MSVSKVLVHALADWMKISDGACDISVELGILEIRQGLTGDQQLLTPEDDLFSYRGAVELYARSSTDAHIKIDDLDTNIDVVKLADELPAVIHATVGIETSIFFDRLFVPKFDAFSWSFVADEGWMTEHAYVIKPTAAGEIVVTIKAHDRQNFDRVVAERTFTIKKTAATPAKTMKVLHIGDSTIAAKDTTSVMMTHLKSLADADANLNLELVGTQGEAGKHHEAVEGYTSNTLVGRDWRSSFMLYVNGATAMTFDPINADIYELDGKQYKAVGGKITASTSLILFQPIGHNTQPPQTCTLTKKSGSGAASLAVVKSERWPATAFWNHQTNKLDAAYYLQRTNIALTRDDVVIIEIGGNDLLEIFWKHKNVNDVTNTIIANVETLIQQFRAAVPDINIVYLAHPGACLTQTAATWFRYNMQQVQATFLKFTRTAYSKLHKPDERVYFLNTLPHIDPKYAYKLLDWPISSRITFASRQIVDPIHLSDDGTRQLGDVEFAFLKAL